MYEHILYEKEKKEKLKKKKSKGVKPTLNMKRTLGKLPPKEKVENVKVKDARKRSVETPLYKKDAKVLSPSKKEKLKKEPKKVHHI